MAKAFAFIRNTGTQTFTTTTGTINPGTAIHGFGSTGCGNCCEYIIRANSASIILNAAGYYSIDVGIVATNSAAGNITINLLQDGQVVASGAEAVSGANIPINISFPAGVKVNCDSTLTLQVVASAGTPIINGVYVTVEKM